MTVHIIKNFLTSEECAQLNAIALQGVAEGWLGNGVNKYGGGTSYALRKTSRMHMQNFEYPQFVRDISEKVRIASGVSEYPTIDGHGKDGVVVSVTYQNGEVYTHRDPNGGEGIATYRCNVLTQANEDGAELYVNGNKVDIEVGDLHCYAVSELPHGVSIARGPTPRIMWMFGAHVPLKDLKDKGML